MHRTKNIDWREPYREVLFEGNARKLPERIELAHQAIQRRVCQLSDTRPTDTRELSQLAYASHFLALLTRITDLNRKSEGKIFSGFATEESRP